MSGIFSRSDLLSPVASRSAIDDQDAAKGRLAENIVNFVRILRQAGLPLGPGHAIRAIEATSVIGWSYRDDFYWTLHAALVTNHQQRPLFDQAFHLFWRNPDIMSRMMGLVLPTMRTPDAGSEQKELLRRISEAVTPNPVDTPPPSLEQEPDKIEIDAHLTFSAYELLQHKDFEQMSRAESDAAQRAMKQLRLPLHQLPTRRYRPYTNGSRFDLRNMLRASLRQGGNMITLRRKATIMRPPPLVILCDISGSMSKYSRMLLHFLHSLTNDRERVHSFLFGTRLTNVTRYLRMRDVDIALSQLGEKVLDWSGGTRLGSTLAAFNRDWSRRVLSQGAVILLITDGLDREGGAGLSSEIERLHKSCRRLIWLNPLLRYEGYVPKASAARLMLPHIDELRGCHNLASLADLIMALSGSASLSGQDIAPWIAKLNDDDIQTSNRQFASGDDEL